jgi:hypothetical protein
MADFTVLNAGEKLVVGQLDMSFLTASSKLTPGTAVINGPCYIGLTPQIGIARATCMIGPPIPGVTAPVSLEVTGITNFAGITNTAGTINDLALSNIFGFTSRIGAEIQAAFKAIFGLKSNAAVQITQGPKVCQAIATVPLIKADQGIFNNCTAALGVFSAVAAPFKKFDIIHPTKSGYRLVHTCLEGPEIGVYYRGRLVNSNVIELPEYWRGLVDAETITVSLTPHTFHQELYVKSIEWGTRIKIVNNCGGPVDCSYIVYAERKDVPRLEIEPKQEEDKIYPGDNAQ